MERLTTGQQIIVGGDQVMTVDEELAAAFQPGDRLIVVADTGAVLHVPEAQFAAAEQAVAVATDAFAALGSVTDKQITTFFAEFADCLCHKNTLGPIVDANARDVAAAEAAGRPTNRLVLTEKMRDGMVIGLRGWRDSPLRRGGRIATINHDGWVLEARRAPLGVVGFVFEGRPNVFADAAGVVRTGNTVVMRIGSDSLGTAEAIVEHALAPALDAAGLPPGTVTLLRSKQRAAGWALFSQPELALAVARGSGSAVQQLGAVARQSGIPVSLHGTGGAWLVAGTAADADRFAASVTNSLDRKVCNTLNVCCIPETRTDLVPVFLDALDKAAAALGTTALLHVEEGSVDHVPDRQSEPIATAELGIEWEWDKSPEVTLVVTDSVDAAVELHNRLSPHFVTSLISEDADEQERFYAAVDAPFVGDGFTRWVDGQYALDTPELGLSNWQYGRLLGRGGVLSGESIHTVRYRATIDDPDLRR